MIDLPHPQTLINSGTAWQLEGHIGRQVMDLIESGQAILAPEHQRDYWGNRIPGRHDVIDGTKGSLGFANKQRERRGLDPLTEDQFDEGLGLWDEEEL